MDNSLLDIVTHITLTVAYSAYTCAGEKRNFTIYVQKATMSHDSTTRHLTPGQKRINRVIEMQRYQHEPRDRRMLSFELKDGTYVSFAYVHLHYAALSSDHSTLVLWFSADSVTLTGISLAKLHQQVASREVFTIQDVDPQRTDRETAYVQKIHSSKSWDTDDAPKFPRRI